MLGVMVGLDPKDSCAVYLLVLLVTLSSFYVPFC